MCATRRGSTTPTSPPANTGSRSRAKKCRQSCIWGRSMIRRLPGCGGRASWQVLCSLVPAMTVLLLRRRLDQALARVHAREAHLLHRGGDGIAAQPHHRIGRCREVGGLREVLAEMRAAAVFAGERGGDDRPADEDLVLEIEPVHPGEVVGALRAASPHALDVPREALEARLRAPEALAVAQYAGIVPHQRKQRPAHAFEIALGAAEGCESAFFRGF